jgi:hypothetical protein
MPGLADATLAESGLGLACSDSPGQWRRMSEPPPQQHQTDKPIPVDWSG